MKSKFNVTGMGCAACQARVEKAVSGLAGVTSCEVNLLANSMSVEGTATSAEIIAAVEQAGYGASLQSEDPDPREGNEENFKFRLIASIILLIPLMYFAMNHQLAAVQLVLSFLVIIVNRKFFISGIKGVMHGAANMDTLVAMGSGVSFLWSIYAMISGNGDLYFDSAAMILTLITVGKMLEAYSKGKTTNAINSLMELAPETDLQVGDVFTVKPGMNIPTDAEIIEGNTTVDESALTGESEPVAKSIGDIVSAATTNLYGEIKCRAIRVGKDTTFAKIVELVSEASASKAPIARIADKVSGVFVPVVIGIALITLIAWMIIGLTAEFALTRAISVLVISCPCALGLATPVAIMVGNGIAAKRGILFKNAEALETAGKVKTVVLDKTGTITTGQGDKIREDSKSAIAELQKMGIVVVMLSGDKQSAAQKIADEVSIKNFVAECLPADKEKTVQQLKQNGLLAMVGDGINDAPALTTADIGIAIGAGTDVAIDAADVVLMNSKLSDVVTTIKLSKATLRNIHQNLFWAFIYNAIGIPLAAGCFIGLLGWQLNPMFGAAAMSLSSFCVVTNALRLNLFRADV